MRRSCAFSAPAPAAFSRLVAGMVSKVKVQAFIHLTQFSDMCLPRFVLLYAVVTDEASIRSRENFVLRPSVLILAAKMSQDS